MAGVPVSEFEKHWQHECQCLKEEYKDIIKLHPDAADTIEQVYKVLGDIVALAGCTPASVGESEAWSHIVKATKVDRTEFCRVLSGKQLFSALYGMYSVALNDLKKVLQTSAKRMLPQQRKPNTEQSQEDGFQEQKRRKRRNSAKEEDKKGTDSQAVAPYQRVLQVPTRNFFAPLRADKMETANEPNVEDQSGQQDQQAPTNKAGRPPPIVLTSKINLIAVQKEIKLIVTGSFEFRNTRTGTKIMSKEMADYSAIRQYLEAKHLSYYTFFPKSEKPIKAVIRHLLHDTPAEDISNSLNDLGFDVINVKQMTSKKPGPQGRTEVNLPLFLVTLPRTEKSQQIFKLNKICNIIIKVEAYRAQSGLTQCYNCQQFGHVWANCRQPPRCLWCGRGHLHKECPEKQKEDSSPRCCNCTLKDGEQPHPSSYRGCSHAKEEISRRRSQNSSNKGQTGRLFSSKHVVPGQSFAAALRGDTQQDPQVQRAQQAQNPEDRAQIQPTMQKTGQSVQAPSVNSSSLDDMFKVATIVQQIMTELNGAVSEENKIVAITKIVLNLMKQNGH